MNKPFFYDTSTLTSSVTPFNYAHRPHMTLVVAAKYVDGIFIKSDSITVLSEEKVSKAKAANKKLFRVTDVIFEPKIFQVTSHLVVSVAGSIPTIAFRILGRYAEAYRMSNKNDLSDAILNIAQIMQEFTIQGGKAELLFAGYDLSTQSLKIISVKIENGKLKDPDRHEFCHALGAKSMVEWLLDAKNPPESDIRTALHAKEVVDLVTDNIFLNASLEEKELIAKNPREPWHIAGTVQKWAITADGAKEEQSDLPDLTQRVFEGDIQDK